MKTFSIISTIAILASSLVGCAFESAETGSDEVGVTREPLDHTGRCNAIEAKRAANTWVGLAVTGCLDKTDGSVKTFQNATIAIGSTQSAAKIVQGLILSKWNFLGANASVLKYPTTDESNPLFGGGKFSAFQFGNIYWQTGASQAFEVHGSIASTFFNLGNEWGTMGFPTSDERPFSPPTGRRKNDFQFGKIYWMASRGPWITLTQANLNAKFSSMPNFPQVTSSNITSFGPGNDAHISVTAKGFTAGASAHLRLTHPQNGIVYMSPSATVAANGTVTVRNNSNSPIHTSLITKVPPGILTLWVFQDDGHQAAITATTNAGNTFTGAL